MIRVIILTIALTLCGVLLISQDSHDELNAVNNLCDGIKFHEFILVYSNRYGYLRREGFDSQRGAVLFALDKKNTVVRPRLYRVEEIKDCAGITSGSR